MFKKMRHTIRNTGWRAVRYDGSGENRRISARSGIMDAIFCRRMCREIRYWVKYRDGRCYNVRPNAARTCQKQSLRFFKTQMFWCKIEKHTAFRGATCLVDIEIMAEIVYYLPGRWHSPRNNHPGRPEGQCRFNHRLLIFWNDIIHTRYTKLQEYWLWHPRFQEGLDPRKVYPRGQLLAYRSVYFEDNYSIPGGC